jgi:hypothetical protein
LNKKLAEHNIDVEKQGKTYHEEEVRCKRDYSLEREKNEKNEKILCFEGTEVIFSFFLNVKSKKQKNAPIYTLLIVVIGLLSGMAEHIEVLAPSTSSRTSLAWATAYGYHAIPVCSTPVLLLLATTSNPCPRRPWPPLALQSAIQPSCWHFRLILFCLRPAWVWL